MAEPLKIMVKPAEVSYEAVTALLHKAYGADPTSDFPAGTQTAEETRARVGEGGFCYVGFADDTLVATLTASKRGSRYLLKMFAVDPDCQKCGYGRQMIEYAVANTPGIVTLDTDARKKNLVAAYERMGFRKTGLISWSNTVYYSVDMTYLPAERLLAQWKRKLKYFCSVLSVKTMYRADGKPTALWGFLLKLLKKA